jgi:hypothetical protein
MEGLFLSRAEMENIALAALDRYPRRLCPPSAANARSRS